MLFALLIISRIRHELQFRISSLRIAQIVTAVFAEEDECIILPDK
jgi:hypothetical protein